MGSDVFPATLNTWIGAAAARGAAGRQEINRHLMGTYASPLRVYFLGTNCTWLGEPDEVINGFFADRLARPDFIDDWLASGLRLRRWLMNAFCFYLKELRRRQLSRRMQGAADELEGPVTFSGDPDAATDRAAALSFARQAMLDAERACASEGLGEHWRIFLRHHLDGAPLRDVGREFGVDAARAAVMSRTAARKFRTALHEILIRDGATAERLDDEIHSLLEATGR